MTISLIEFLFRLGAALLMGICVGLERQWRQRMAGTRTNALVAAGAAAFVMCGFMVRDNSRGEAQIVSYVVSGIGFLGAGVISSRVDSHRSRSDNEHRSPAVGVSPLSGSGFRRGTGSYVWIRADLPSRRRSAHASPAAAGDV